VQLFQGLCSPSIMKRSSLTAVIAAENSVIIVDTFPVIADKFSVTADELSGSPVGLSSWCRNKAYVHLQQVHLLLLCFSIIGRSFLQLIQLHFQLLLPLSSHNEFPSCIFISCIFHGSKSFGTHKLYKSFVVAVVLLLLLPPMQMCVSATCKAVCSFQLSYENFL